MVKITSFCEGPDASIIELAARTLCREGGGNCWGGKRCASISKCHHEGWPTYAGYVETVLKVIRKTHVIAPKEATAPARDGEK